MNRLPLDTPRFSRLAEYALDRETKKAKLVWEFRPMLNSTTHAYSFHAGSASRLSNGHTIGGFVCDNTLAGSECTIMVYEADEDGKELARLRMPSSNRSGMAYRALPLDSIGGERRQTVVI